MPMTNDEIRALREKSQYLAGYHGPHEVYPVHRYELHELCTRLLSAEALNKDFRKELAQAIANSSRFEEDRKVLQARVKLLQDALRHISRDTELDHIGDRWQTRIAVYAQEVLEALAE